MTAMIPPNVPFPVPLTAKARTIARKRVYSQFDARQQYRAGLARYAVEFYLSCMAFDLAPTVDRDSEAITAQLLEGADATILGLGRIACCAVEPGDSIVCVSADAWSARLTHAIVQIDAQGKRAEILGFSSKAVPDDGCIALDQLQPIDELPQYLHDCQATTILSQAWTWALAREQQLQTLTASIGIALQNWQLSPLEPHFAVRAPRSPHIGLTLPQPRSADRTSRSPQVGLMPDDPISIAKAIYLKDLALDLVVSISPKEDGRLRVVLTIAAGDRPLPQGVSLTVLDETGQIFQQLNAPGDSAVLTPQPFSAVPRDRFALELRYDTAQHVENFAV